MDDDFPYYTSTNVIGNSKRKCRSQSQAQASVSRHTLGSMDTKVLKKPRGRPPVQRQYTLPLAMIGQPLVGTPLKLRTVQSCTKCLAKKFVYESRKFCCGDGTIVLPSSIYPPELTRLFTSPDPISVHFRQFARLYNNLFAFSSIGGHIESDTIKGIYVFKLHGQIYHNVPDLVPQDSNPKFLQLYFYDGQHEAANRTSCFKELNRAVIDILMSVTETNPYARFFRSLQETNITEDTKIHLTKNPTHDQRVSNAPTSDEVAAIWSEDSTSGKTSGPHILVTGHSQTSHRIMHFYGCYDPLQYPLLFPKGECGWHQGLKKNVVQPQEGTSAASETAPPESFPNAEALLEAEAHQSSQQVNSEERNVSCREYYCYKLQNRPGNMMLRAGRCLQQYVVDMYVKLENTRLDFLRRNQDTIRSELYQGLLDTIDAGEQIAANVGRRVILPATYIGGPRDMRRRYLNAMALVQRYGKPDFFLTITCNAQWPEIKNELACGEEAHNRPDIVARVFRAKLLALKKKIVEEKIFGEVAAFVYVVEFQKRGLPHAHILLIMKPGSKMNCPDDFDKFVSAEIPPVTNENLRRAVLRHMMHGPCGQLNPDCSCMKHEKSSGRCKYAYPKPFTSETTNSDDGYPVYRRRQTGESVQIRGKTLNNRWVIPYNPYLIDLFDCHLNVEVCSTIQAVKYLYKYVYKGHDRISFNVAKEGEVKLVDEIHEYQSGRWVSPVEAIWRIYGFDLFEIQPPVMALPIHLPGMQTIQMRPHETLSRVVSNKKRIRTPLTEFFKINSENADKPGDKHLYGNFTEHYRWDTTQRTWFKRKTKTFVIARLVFVAPSEGERFFLRLLLAHVVAPKSFEDLRTVDGYHCSTYQEAALKLKLIEDDNMVELSLDEAAAVQMPCALRRLFATILLFCQPKNPAALWDKYYTSLSEDYSREHPNDAYTTRVLTVRQLERHLEAMGKSLKSLGLAHLNEPQDVLLGQSQDILDALNAPIPEQCMISRDSLNSEQQEAFNIIMEHVRENKPGAFFVDGPGGTGKTYLYNALYAELRLMGKIVLPTATSGIAAANIPSGRTTHSRFKLPIDLEISLSCAVPKQSSLAALIRATSLIIWDEASMARKESVEALDQLLRDLCNPDLIFGGKLIVFGGDFRQVLPVVPHKSIREVVKSSMVASVIWPQLRKFRLSINMRAKTDPGFSDFLLSLGNGELQTKESELVQLPEGIVQDTSKLGTDLIAMVANTAYPESDINDIGTSIFNNRSILTPMNEDVDDINTFMINKFPGPAIVYKGFDSMLTDNCNIYPSEFINKLCPGGMSPYELILKKNCPVILLRNLLPSAGLCNGTRLICVEFTPNLIECIITNGHHSGEHVFIPRIKMRPPTSSNYPFQFQRNQFPLKLSFAMTINKSQGQTLDQVAVYLPRPCFSPGQLYVALSRAREASKVTVVTASTECDSSEHSVKNIVSFEVLRLAGII